jgi:hypothetical protein
VRANQNPKSKIQNPPFGLWSFGFRYSGFIRHSSFVIRVFLSRIFYLPCSIASLGRLLSIGYRLFHKPSFAGAPTASLPFLSSILCLLSSFAAITTALAQKTEPPRPAPLDPVQAEKEARVLVHDILSQVPEKNSTNTGVLKIRDADGKRREIPIRFEVFSTRTNWVSVYQTSATTNGPGQKLIVIHNGTAPSQFKFSEGASNHASPTSPNDLMVPFAGSDFWLGDLGLEFFHWPRQRLTKKELRRGQSCDVLESTNPQPARGAYSRVVCWIDIDPPHGIIHADAFDPKGELLKQFDPKKLEKVHGQYQLESMEIRNHKTGSRTLIEFLDLDK